MPPSFFLFAGCLDCSSMMRVVNLPKKLRRSGRRHQLATGHQQQKRSKVHIHQDSVEKQATNVDQCCCSAKKNTTSVPSLASLSSDSTDSTESTQSMSTYIYDISILETSPTTITVSSSRSSMDEEYAGYMNESRPVEVPLCFASKEVAILPAVEVELRTPAEPFFFMPIQKDFSDLQERARAENDWGYFVDLAH